MKKITFLVFGLCALCAVVFMAGTSQAQTDIEIKPQIQTHSFPGVSTFTTPSGRLGFFDQATGKIFIYDDNFSACVFIGQLSELGKPIEKIQ